MQDPRLRLLAVVVLSLAAFSGLTGAFLAFLWYISCSGGPWMVRRSWWPLVAFVPLLLVTAALWFAGGEWFSYCARLGVVLLIAIYAYQDQKPGEFIQVCTWAFGPRVGFDIGLAGEMCFSAIHFLEGEVRRFRQAYRMKKVPFGVRSLIPLSTSLVFGLVRRADDQADLLLARGYERGGVSCARFGHSGKDYIASGIAVFLFFISFLPFREFFILVQ